MLKRLSTDCHAERLVSPRKAFPTCAVTWTVDFRFDGGTFSIAGESSVLLSEVFSRLSVGREASDVVSCEFSDPALLSVGREGDDWRLASLAPFSTEERLSCTFPDGDVVEIRVTDATINNGGSKVVVAGNHDDYMSSFAFTDARIDPGKINTATHGPSGSTYSFASSNPNLVLSTSDITGQGDTVHAICWTAPITQNASPNATATLLFYDAAEFSDGSHGDVRIQLTIEDFVINDALVSSYPTQTFVWNGHAPCLFAWNGTGRPMNSGIGIQTKVDMQVLNKDGTEHVGSKLIWQQNEIDGPDAVSYATSTFAGAYCEGFVIDYGAQSKAYIPRTSGVAVDIAGSSATPDANGLWIRASQNSPATTAQYGAAANCFSMLAGSHVIERFRASGAHGGGLITKAVAIKAAPYYRAYNNGTLSGWVLGSTGGGIQIHDYADQAWLSWSVGAAASTGYLTRYAGNGKAVPLNAVPSEGFYRSDVTYNGATINSTFNSSNNSFYINSLNADGFVEAYYTPVTGTVTIKKADASTGEPLAGAEFTCSGTSSVHGAFSLTSADNGDGTYTIANVPYGRASDAYTVSETRVPAGYEAAPDQTVAGDAFV